MRMTVFGSTGKIGRRVLEQALGQGHEVTAFTRNPNAIITSHKNLRVVMGYVLDSVAVKSAVEGQDVVICTLGMPLMNKAKLRQRGTKIIVDAMEEVGVKRLICLSVFGSGDSFGLLPLHYCYLIFPIIMRHILADHEAQEAIIAQSNLDWVVVRPANFVDGLRTGKYRSGITAADKGVTLKISYGDVADFMLGQVKDNKWLHRAPAISN